LFQLQVLFTFLQSARQAVYNPLPLVNSLNLDTGEQQDAQEFSKLFLNLLDHEFQKQGLQEREDGSPDLSTLVEDQVRSRISVSQDAFKCE
jgi:ubiquitin C-terminal hydrolase